MERYIRMGDTVNRSISYQHLFRDYIVANPNKDFEYDDPDRQWNPYRWEYEKLAKELAEVKQQSEEHRKAYEMEKALMEAKYKAEIERLKEQPDGQLHQDSIVAATTQVTGQAPSLGLITLEEMIAYVKEKYLKVDADTFTLMLYRIGTSKKDNRRKFLQTC